MITKLHGIYEYQVHNPMIKHVRIINTPNTIPYLKNKIYDYYFGRTVNSYDYSSNFIFQ